MEPHPTDAQVLQLLRQLPPRDRLNVIAQALPEATRDLDSARAPLPSMLGLLKDLGPAPSEADIDEARGEMWRAVPRDYI